jgi:hypothetical protein
VPAWQNAQRRGKDGRASKAPPPEPPQQQQHDRPVDFVRVLLPPDEFVKHTIDGWPVWFTRKMGRGRVLFTTLGPRGWHRPRQARDGRSPFDFYPRLPVLRNVVGMVPNLLQPIREGLRIDSLQQGLADEIGYSTVHRSTAAVIFGAFLLVTLGVGIVLRRWGRPELLGWVGPAAALAATVAFVALGEASRRAATATIAVAQVVEGDSLTQDAAVRGLMAVYRPDSGPFALAANRGGRVEMDLSGVQGQATRWVTSDLGRWHLENLELPAGVRFSPFRQSLGTAQPIAAVAHFGAEGLEGKMTAGPLRGLSDALLDGPGDRQLALRLHAEDGSFRAGSRDLLPPGEFLAGTLLTDRQQRRQEIYRSFLKRPPTGRVEERTLLLAWADPLDMGLGLGQEVRMAGSALVVLPVRLERSAPGARVTIPGPLVWWRRLFDRGGSGMTREGNEAADLHLRFQIPPVVLPFKIERVRLTVRMDAPSRRVTVGGWEDSANASGRLTELHRVESPLDPIRVDISRKSLLRQDTDGGLHLNIHVGDLLKGKSGAAVGGGGKWTIHYLDLEVTGRAE